MFIRLSIPVLVAACISLARATPLVARDDPVCARNYTVAFGDTCDSISAAQKVSTFQLAHANPLIDATCDNLFVFESLCLGVKGQDCRTVHVVVEGDICVHIATAASIPLATLLANNPNIDAACTNIYPGEVLCAANEIIPYA